jgi:hypothetical protein
MSNSGGLTSLANSGWRRLQAPSQNLLQSLHSGRMPNSGGLTSLANSGRQQLEAPSQNVLQSLHSGRMPNSGGLTSLANSGRRRLKGPSQNVLQSLHSGRMPNSCGLTSLANSGRLRLKAPPLLPRKRPPLDSNAARGIPIEPSDSDSSPSSTRQRRRKRRPHSPSQHMPLANPPSTAKALIPRRIKDPLLVAPVITCSQQLGDKRNKIRLTQANANDARMISKYLPARMDTIMPQPIMGPDNHFQPPPDFLIRFQ